VLELQNTVEQQREQMAAKDQQLSAAAVSMSAMQRAPGSPGPGVCASVFVCVCVRL